MGREVRRVPAGFDWPLNKPWEGFTLPESLVEEDCRTCGGSGLSPDGKRLQDRWYGKVPFDPAETGSAPFTVDTPQVRTRAVRHVTTSPWFYGVGEPAVQAEAARLAKFWNGAWQHHLAQEDVDALIAGERLWDFTREWVKGTGWVKLDPAPVVTAEQVNLWSVAGMGHDSLNAWIVTRAYCARNGLQEGCSTCAGFGTFEKYPGQRAEAEAWEPTGPPEGDGWQLWETVSSGSPVSPVFPTAEDLARWIADGDVQLGFDAALRFVREGWAPTAVAVGDVVVDGITFVGSSPARWEAGAP